MLLCLDVGNTQIFAGVFKGDKIMLRFRHDSRSSFSSDQIGIFLKNVLRENNILLDHIEDIVICSVVPHLDYTLRAACIKYFSLEPFHIQAGIKTGLKIKYRNPLEVGADRIANAIAAVNLHPGKNLIVVDFGTATTFCAISDNKEYLGGVILPGLKISMLALEANTSKLATVEIIKPQSTIGRSTVESIQSGLYYSQLAMVREMVTRITEENFSHRPLIIGTGGFSHLYAEERVFDHLYPDLVLHGLRMALSINKT